MFDVYHTFNTKLSGIASQRILKILDVFMNEMTGNEDAEQLNSARDHLFKQFHERLKMRV